VIVNAKWQLYQEQFEEKFVAARFSVVTSRAKQ
jgi:hypothetical protein